MPRRTIVAVLTAVVATAAVGTTAASAQPNGGAPKPNKPKQCQVPRENDHFGPDGVSGGTYGHGYSRTTTETSGGVTVTWTHSCTNGTFCSTQSEGGITRKHCTSLRPGRPTVAQPPATAQH